MTTRDDHESSRPNRFPPWLIVAVALVLVGVAVLIWARRNRGEDPQAGDGSVADGESGDRDGWWRSSGRSGGSGGWAAGDQGSTDPSHGGEIQDRWWMEEPGSVTAPVASASAVATVMQELEAPLDRCYRNWEEQTSQPLEAATARFVISHRDERYSAIGEVDLVEPLPEQQALMGCIQEVFAGVWFAPLPEGGRITVVQPLVPGPGEEETPSGPSNLEP